jgi:hypothetical protein
VSSRGFVAGGAERIRTPDPLLANYLQLSQCRVTMQVTRSVMVTEGRPIYGAAAVLSRCTWYPVLASDRCL